MRYRSLSSLVVLCAIAIHCGSSKKAEIHYDVGTIAWPSAACAKATGGGAKTVSPPTLVAQLKDSWQEAWLGSPSVVDIDGDGKKEIIVPRENLVEAWHLDGTLVWKYDTGSDRIWASPVIADFDGDGSLEVAVAARGKVHLIDGKGKIKSGFPVAWAMAGELRSITAGDLDGDGNPEIIVSPANGKSVTSSIGDVNDTVNAWKGDGTPVANFPPISSGISGCTNDSGNSPCYTYWEYDQNIAVGDLDGDGKADIAIGHDDAYISIYHSTGVMWDSNAMFRNKKVAGVRMLLDLSLAIQGYADNEETALQAHFTNTPPAIADIDGDGKYDVLYLSSVQNAAQSNRFLGVALWALHPDASRLTGWESPFYVAPYLAGLWDYDGTNIVGATNQVSVADIDPSRKGLEMVFAGFDGYIHAVSADQTHLWTYQYTTSDQILTSGVDVVDLSGDGVPEIVFATYSTQNNVSNLFILDATGQLQQKVALSGRGAMPIPTIADIDGDGTLEIVVSLKDAQSGVESVVVYNVPGSSSNCMPWPTARANDLRNGWVK